MRLVEVVVEQMESAPLLARTREEEVCAIGRRLVFNPSPANLLAPRRPAAGPDCRFCLLYVAPVCLSIPLVTVRHCFVIFFYVLQGWMFPTVYAVSMMQYRFIL